MPPDPSTDQPADDLSQPAALPDSLFPVTPWSTVLRTRSAGDDGAQGAMNDLCRRYWFPIYAYLRGRGFQQADAQDITQGFFMMVVSDELFQSADAERGRLRSFLLGALTRHLADHMRKERAVKRGGRAIVIPLECDDSEERYTMELVDHRDPESIYLKSWARELVNRAMEKLRAHYTRTGRAEVFEALHPVLVADDDKTPYRDIAARLSIPEASIRVQVFRTRQRFGKVLREEVALTVRTPEELQEELDWLVKILQDRT